MKRRAQKRIHKYSIVCTAYDNEDCWGVLSYNDWKEICLPFVKMVVLIRCESEDWKKLWHRLHSQPVFRSLASPATPLVWRPCRTFAQPLLFHILRVARVHTRFCPP